MYSGVIYCATSPSNKKYYGKSVQSMEARKYIHEHSAENTNKQSRFLSALRKYGKNAFAWCIVETLSDESKVELRKKLNEREMYWIQTEKTYDVQYGYNMTLGGDGGAEFGRKLSDETKQKISNSLKGKEYTEERKQNMSKNGKGVSRPKKDSFIPWCKGKTLSEETKKKISEKLKGRKFTEEHKKNLSEAHKK